MANFTSAVAYSSDSAGMHPSHSLPVKLQAIAYAGFRHVEIGMPDIEAFAEQELEGDYQKLNNEGKGDLDKLCDAATKVQSLCQKLGLQVLVVHP